MRKEQKQIYKPPRVELFSLGKRLNLMTNFSTTGEGLDWNEGDILDNELDDALIGKDWKKGGSLGTD